MDMVAGMRVFVQVARQESFTAAGRTLRMSSTAVSRQVRQLEEHLGAKLLHRTTRRVSLTAAGQAALVRAEQVLADVAELEAVVGGDDTPRGTVRITAGVSLGSVRLQRLLFGFLAAHPEVSVELLLTDAQVDLVAERIDLAVRVGARRDSGLIARRLGEVGHRVCASPAWLAARGPVSPQNIAAMPHVVDTNQPAQWHLAGPGGEALAVTAQGQIAVNSAHAAQEACAAGLGLALLPDFVADEALAWGALVDAMPGWSGPRLVVQALYLERRHLSAAVRALLDDLIARWAPAGADGSPADPAGPG